MNCWHGCQCESNQGNHGAGIEEVDDFRCTGSIYWKTHSDLNDTIIDGSVHTSTAAAGCRKKDSHEAPTTS